MTSPDIIFSVSDFVAVFNQTLETAYPNVLIVGELANFRISKNRWVYFDLKDEQASVKFFGSVYGLPGPLEEGMLLKVRGAPRLHPQFGFSINILSIQAVGEGTLKRAAQLLEAKLRIEGLFDDARKRLLPYPPTSIGLIASSESAAYHDFIKILNGRWGGTEINLADVQVQGEAAPGQIIEAINYFNQITPEPEIIVITRGGGSPEDLAAFNTEPVTRAVALSRVPTLVAIGHEIDVSLAELAADKRASTPSHAAELLVPDKKHESLRLEQTKTQITQQLQHIIKVQKDYIIAQKGQLEKMLVDMFTNFKQRVVIQNELLNALSPTSVLQRGYTLVRNGVDKKVIKSVKSVKSAQEVSIEWIDGQAGATITRMAK